MATQTGSIDLTATNAVKLAADASISTALSDYTTHSELSVEANRILGTVSETYATESSVSSRFSTVNQTVHGLEIDIGGKVDSDEPWVSWLHAGVDETTHEPYLAMGQDSDYPSVVYGSSAARFYDGGGDADSNVVASFGSDGALVGKDGAAHTLITDEETRFYDADGNEAGKISMSSEGTVPTSATYTITTSSTGTVSDTITGITPLPDFTLGYLVLRGKVDSASGSLARFESWSDVASPVTMSTSTIDYTFKATPNVDTWGIEITATNRSGYTDPQTVTYALEWYYLGSAPQYKFGTGENAGAYSFLAGMGLKTSKPSQIVLGSYNEPSQTDLLIVGNGTSDENRSNVLSIDENNTLVVNSFSQRYGGVTLTQSALWGWEQALGLSVETIYETANITIKRFGRTVMVQCHGVTGTPNSNTPLANVNMSDYKPSYNASAIVCDTQSTTHFARLWVSKDDGKPYLAFAGYSSSSTWYGTLTYIY